MRLWARKTAVIRWMAEADFPAVLAIEEACFGWDGLTPMRLAELWRCPLVQGQVADGCEAVEGFGLYHVTRQQIEVLDLAVRPDRRRQGIGRALMDRLFACVTPERRALVCPVGEYNLEAQLFLKALGFKAQAVRPGACADGTDAIVMTWQLGRA